MATQDDICPGEVGDSLLALSLTDPLAKRVPYAPVDVAVDYSRTFALGGPCLPIEVIISDPNAQHIDYRVILFSLPLLVTFTPQLPGVHTVLVREMAHNRWRGSIRITIEGKGT